MKKFFKITQATSIAFALAFTLNACGGDDDSSEGGDDVSCPTVTGGNIQACPNATTSSNTVACGSKTYNTTEIGEQTWMAENLNYEAEGSVCYDNNPENCAKYGRLYNWETATKVCPDGWHLPSVAEWDELINFAGGSDIAGTKLKAKSGWNENNGTDDYGFSALPGSSSFPGCHFSLGGVGSDGKWWSSDENTNNSNSSDAYTKSMSDFFGATVAEGNSDKPNLLSVRCIKD